MKQAVDPIWYNLKSILKFPKNEMEGIVSNGIKYFLKTKSNPSGHYGGYSRYFENLSRGRYKENPVDLLEGGGGPRSLNFNIKYISTVEKILSHPRPLRVLDLGCSSGFLRRVLEANVFSPQDIYYYGIDIRVDVLKKAVVDLDDIETGAQGNNIPSLYLNYDLRSGLPFQDNTFDFIVSFEAMKYLKNNEIQELFKEISRVLKKEKTFIYSTTGIFENKKIKKEISKVKGEMVSFWSFANLKESLEDSNLFLMKTYAAETYAGHLQNQRFSPKDEFGLLRMEKLYPPELIAAIFGPFYHEDNPTKLFFISKGRINLLKEVKDIFPKAALLEHPGNSEIFVVGEKIIKYLPKYFFEKHLRIHKILREQTEIKLPELIKISESEISENYILVMEKIKGDLFGNIWVNMPNEKRIVALRQLVRLMKQIHSIHLNFKNAPSHFKLIERTSDWRETLTEFCLLALNQCAKNNLIGEDFYNFLISTLKQNIDYVPTSSRTLLHGDLNLNNLMMDEDLKPTLLFDFEHFCIGDEYLDLVITSAFFEKKDQKTLFDLYGIPDNFDRTARIYRLFLFLRNLKGQKVFEAKLEAVKEFIEKGGPLFRLLPLYEKKILPKKATKK